MTTPVWMPPLSDEAIDELAIKAWPGDEWVYVPYIQFARAVERSAVEAYKASMKQLPCQQDIYNFAGWLTCQPGTLVVGSTQDAAPMADAVKKYVDMFPERFRLDDQP